MEFDLFGFFILTYTTQINPLAFTSVLGEPLKTISRCLFDSKCPTINTASPSYTSPSSNGDMQLHEMSFNDQLSDYERNVDITQHRSRQRHDTITVENENSLNDLEWSSGRFDKIDRTGETDSSFDVTFERDKSQLSTGNNNGKKIDEASSGVVFHHVSIVELLNMCYVFLYDFIGCILESSCWGKGKFSFKSIWE